MPNDLLSGIVSGINPGIVSGINPGIVSGINPGIVSGIVSGIVPGIFSGVGSRACKQADDGVGLLARNEKRIFIELMTSDRKLKAS